jgi:hypothetical protein
MVAFVSRLSSGPFILLSPLASAAIMNARWVYDFEGGADILPESLEGHTVSEAKVSPSEIPFLRYNSIQRSYVRAAFAGIIIPANKYL